MGAEGRDGKDGVQGPPGERGRQGPIGAAKYAFRDKSQGFVAVSVTEAMELDQSKTVNFNSLLFIDRNRFNNTGKRLSVLQPGVYDINGQIGAELPKNGNGDGSIGLMINGEDIVSAGIWRLIPVGDRLHGTMHWTINLDAAMSVAIRIHDLPGLRLVPDLCHMRVLQL
jgi:hypothetical protein